MELANTDTWTLLLIDFDDDAFVLIGSTFSTESSALTSDESVVVTPDNLGRRFVAMIDPLKIIDNSETCST